MGCKTWSADGDRIDPETLDVTDTIDIGTTPASIAVGFGQVWLTAY